MVVPPRASRPSEVGSARGRVLPRRGRWHAGDGGEGRWRPCLATSGDEHRSQERPPCCPVGRRPVGKCLFTLTAKPTPFPHLPSLKKIREISRQPRSVAPLRRRLARNSSDSCERTRRIESRSTHCISRNRAECRKTGLLPPCKSPPDHRSQILFSNTSPVGLFQIVSHNQNGRR